MKNAIFYILTIVLLFSCSTHKNRFLNRQYHGLITKFNVSYNGEQAFDKGLQKVEQTYVDDYRNILPIESFSSYAKETPIDGNTTIGKEEFERAEEKATKAIQKHSMLIYGEERNHQMDEAYLLLGKSRYYTKRFGPALESFQYVIKNYKSADLIYETVIWRAKTNIHLDNADFGKIALLRLLESDKLSKKERQDAEVGVVMALEKTPDSIDPMIMHLENAVNLYKQGSVATRAAFVLGQLYKKKGDIPASDLAFDEVIEMKKGLYKLKLQAKLEKINNHIGEISTEEFLSKVDHLIFLTKNRPYLGKLFYQKGLIYKATDSIEKAKYYLTKSVKKSKNDITQMVLSYEVLGDLYFENKSYSIAKSYYDSLVDFAKNKETGLIKKIQRKSKSLEKIVELEQSIAATDSLLKIASFTDNEAQDFFANHIAKLRAQEKRERLKEQEKLDRQNNVSFENNKDWYFYNTSLKNKGRKEFFKLWRLRLKAKNWFASALTGKTEAQISEDNIVVESLNKVVLDKYKVAFYTEKINKSPEFLNEIAQTRNLNYYELGNEYYNKLKEGKLAADKLTDLLAFDPDSDLVMGTYYRLYKIYQSEKELIKADLYKQKLQTEFPESSFTQLILDAENVDLQRADFEECYKVIYELYRLNSIKAAKEEMKQALRIYGESPLAANYALLNAYLTAKIDGEKQFYRILKEIKLRYPNTEQAQKAEEILKNKK